MPETTAAPPLTWSRAFPGTPAQAREARLFLAAILDGSTAAGDAVLCLSELAANAAIHSRSGQPGGQFTVRAELGGGLLRVEVRDQGGPWTWLPAGDARHGRGLLIVAGLARAWGREGDSATGWTVWYEMAFPPDQHPLEHR
jgi:anti-sigma regulatory factor (Ser/Thr protein kinase)